MITLRIARRSTLGVAIRDTSRMRNLNRVLELCPSTSAVTSAPLYTTITSMHAFTHQFVAKGRLWGRLQIVDVMDHPSVFHEAKHFISSFSPQHGYYTEETLGAMSRIVLDELRMLVMTHVPAVLRNTGSKFVVPFDESSDGNTSDEIHLGSDGTHSDGDNFSSSDDEITDLIAGEDPNDQQRKKRRRSIDEDQWSASD
jgi:hypothetical protein